MLNHNLDIHPNIKKKEKYTTYSWSMNNTEEVISDKNLPDWYDPYAYVQVSEFSSWQEVAQTAVLLMTNGFITGEVIHIDGGGRYV